MSSSSPSSTIAPILRVLRIGHGWTQQELARSLALDRGYLSHIERGERQPSAKVLQRWVTACPVPVVPITALIADLTQLHRGDQLAAETPVGDWRYVIYFTLSAVASGDPSCESRWSRRSWEALRFPALESTSPDLEPDAILWLTIRAARHADARVPRFGTDPKIKAEEDASPPLTASYIESHILEPIWAIVQEIPIELAPTPPDLLLERMLRLWPNLSQIAREGLVAAAEKWVKHA